MSSRPHTAFVIDSLPSLGGGEKVLFAALEANPRADIFTLVYNKPIFTHTPLAQREVSTSYLNMLPLARNHHRLLLPLMPAAVEAFDLREYDRIVCFSYAVAHGVKSHNGARHLSYTFTPMRYAWMDLNINGQRTRRNIIVEAFMRTFRAWDKKAASRVHRFASISEIVSQRICRAFNRDAPVIYPPVEVERFKPDSVREDFFIAISRLVPHKRMEIIVRAFNQLGLSLVIIGDGSELPRLKAMARSNIKFLGFQSDESLASLLGKARAFVCAAEEDFGIAIVEAQAAGCPVIAYGAGGARETLIENVTGLFFEEQTVENLVAAIQRFEKSSDSFSIAPIVQNAQRFSKPRFIREFKEFVGS